MSVERYENAAAVLSSKTKCSLNKNGGKQKVFPSEMSSQRRSIITQIFYLQMKYIQLIYLKSHCSNLWSSSATSRLDLYHTQHLGTKKHSDYLNNLCHMGQSSSEPSHPVSTEDVLDGLTCAYQSQKASPPQFEGFIPRWLKSTCVVSRQGD